MARDNKSVLAQDDESAAAHNQVPPSPGGNSTLFFHLAVSSNQPSSDLTLIGIDVACLLTLSSKGEVIPSSLLDTLKKKFPNVSFRVFVRPDFTFPVELTPSFWRLFEEYCKRLGVFFSREDTGCASLSSCGLLICLNKEVEQYYHAIGIKDTIVMDEQIGELNPEHVEFFFNAVTPKEPLAVAVDIDDTLSLLMTRFSSDPDEKSSLNPNVIRFIQTLLDRGHNLHCFLLTARSDLYQLCQALEALKERHMQCIDESPKKADFDRFFALSRQELLAKDQLFDSTFHIALAFQELFPQINFHDPVFVTDYTAEFSQNSQLEWHLLTERSKGAALDAFTQRVNVRKGVLLDNNPKYLETVQPPHYGIACFSRPGMSPARYAELGLKIEALEQETYQLRALQD